MARSTVRITSQNVKQLPIMSEAKVRSDVALTFRQSDVIGWQEMQNQDKADWYWRSLREMETLGWETYAGGDRPRDSQVEDEDDPDFDRYYSTPISWRSSQFDFVKGGRFLLNKGSAGISGNRYLTWVKLRDKRTRTAITFINVHMVVGAHSYKYSDRAKRLDIWTKAFAMLRAFVQLTPGPVVITGDFNARDLVMRPRPASWRVFNPKGIDHIILRGVKLRRPVFQKLLGRFSDHQGVRVTVKLR